MLARLCLQQLASAQEPHTSHTLLLMAIGAYAAPHPLLLVGIEAYAAADTVLLMAINDSLLQRAHALPEQGEAEASTKKTIDMNHGKPSG
jgi:hypothetical protein